MMRMIQGELYKGTPDPTAYRATVRQLGDHAELTLAQQMSWEHVATLTPAEIEKWHADKAEEAAERSEVSARRAARRAKTIVRRKIKVMGLDSLLTLTYRENQQDRSLAWRHLREFCRRLRRALPGFAYVAVLERQKRGAWHVHMAINRLPLTLPGHQGVKVKSWDVVRAVWRSVVGDLGGNVDLSNRRGGRYLHQTVTRVANYISKYFAKTWGDLDEANRKRYTSSRCVIPDPDTLVFRGTTFLELAGLLYAFVPNGYKITRSYATDDHSFLYVAASRSP